MTPYELLMQLKDAGLDRDYDDLLDGWFGWELQTTSTGDVELVLGFTDAADDSESEARWVLRARQ